LWDYELPAIEMAAISRCQGFFFPDEATSTLSFTGVIEEESGRPLTLASFAGRQLQLGWSSFDTTTQRDLLPRPPDRDRAFAFP
jgi:hypothetical protein